MKVERKRIFISDLPEAAKEADVETAFKNFGNVVSVEIKKRKEIIKNNSLYFAYVNIEIDDRDLDQCFKHFSNKKWFGQNLVLQIARESFIDRLKREREENDKNNILVKENATKIIQHNTISNGIKQKFETERDTIENVNSNTDLSRYSDNDGKCTTSRVSRTIKNTVLDFDSSSHHSKDINHTHNTEETSDLIIKNNKGKSFDKHGLKIKSVGNEPIIKIEKSQKKFVLNSSEANLKRLQSLKNLKKNYQTQKSVIQTALSQIDRYPKNKIIFDDNTESTDSVNLNDNLTRNHLFDDDQSEDEVNIDFTVKEHFQGKEGQKLLALQSKYKNDKRFTLDSRFVDDDTKHEYNNSENGENSLKEEKNKEYEILEKILGKDVSKPKYLDESKSQKKSMLRFDPTQPEHSKFEMKKEVENQKKRKNKSNEESVNKKKQEEKEVPEVSKETFYKVTDGLKETLHEKQEFSLLSMFGKSDDKDLEDQEAEATPKIVISNKYIKEESNPFKYDSSDDEDETQTIPNKNETEESVDNRITAIKTTHWSEPFFFKNDDYRLQEGFEFIEKMKVEENTEFSKLRRDLKEIVKAKVRNNQRKHKPFKKKLGGNKRKKMIRMKKALRR